MEEIWGTGQRGSDSIWKEYELLTFAARSIVLSNSKLIWIKTKIVRRSERESEHLCYRSVKESLLWEELYRKPQHHSFDVLLSVLYFQILYVMLSFTLNSWRVRVQMLYLFKFHIVLQLILSEEKGTKYLTGALY